MNSILEKLPPNACLLEPRLVFDSCLIGVTDNPDDHWPRKEKQVVAVYDTHKTIAAIEFWLECSPEEALDWFNYNTCGAWVGEGTPTFKVPSDSSQ